MTPSPPQVNSSQQARVKELQRRVDELQSSQQIPPPLTDEFFLKLTSAATMPGLYNARAWYDPPNDFDPTITANPSPLALGQDPGYDDCYALNMAEFDAGTHVLTTPVFFPSGKFLLFATDGKPVFAITAISTSYGNGKLGQVIMINADGAPASPSFLYQTTPG